VFTPTPLQPADLGLILSYQCQCACAHCLYNCGPDWKDWMPPDEIYEALSAMQSAWGNTFQVHLTGGEPFFKFPLLLYATQIASELDISCYVETNAGWCVREELVIDRFQQLRQAGLKAILISCSPFHAVTIPPERTLRAINLAGEVFGPRNVIIYQPEWLDLLIHFGTEHPTPLEAYTQTYGAAQAGRFFWQGYGLISGGRSGYQLGHLLAGQPPESFQDKHCRQEILYAHHSHLDLYGNYISGFCGGLTVGDWHSLPKIINEFRLGDYPPLVEMLIADGPFGLFNYACENFAYQQLSQGYAGKCHLCVDVRSHLASAAEFNELAPRQFYSSL
jgi:hypothetical protein